MRLGARLDRARVLQLVDSGGLYGAEMVILTLAQELKGSPFVPLIGALWKHSAGEPEILRASKELEVEHVGIRYSHKVDPSVFIRLMDCLISQRIDVVHSHGYKPTLLSYIPCLLLKVPLIATCHLWYHENDYKLKLYHTCEAHIMKSLPCVIGVSKSICKSLLSNGINQNNIRLIYNGINLKNYREATAKQVESLRKELNITPDTFVIGTSGRLTHQKAQHILIESTRQLFREKVNIKVLIFGDGPLRNSLERQVDASGLGDVVRFLGFRRDAVSLFAVLDAFVLTSYDEGLPMVLLEAMAKKKAIITTPVGAIEDVIEDGKSGLVFMPGDTVTLSKHLRLLHSNPALRETLGANAYELFDRQYSSSIMANRYKHLYMSLISRE